MYFNLMKKEEKKQDDKEKKMTEINTKNRPYFIQRITNETLKSKTDKEKIKNVSHKVDNYLKHLEELENNGGINLLINKDDFKGKKTVDDETLGKIVNRLYTVKKVEKKEKVEKDVKKLDSIKKKSKNVEKTEIILPTILKKERDNVRTEIKENIAKSIKRGKSAFSRIIRKGIANLIKKLMITN